MRINRYFDFISESKLSLILEANMVYSDRFIGILSKLKSPISKQILSLKGKDVDVSTNHIDLTDKDDTIAFIPDNKSKSFATKVIDSGRTYDGLTNIAKGKLTFDIGDVRYPTNDQPGIIVRELTVDELMYLHKSMAWQNMYDQGRGIVQFRFTDEHGTADIFIEKSGLANDYSSIPKSEIKVGRFTRRLLDKSGIKPSDKEIEEFVNQFKARVEIEKDVLRLFEVVKGMDIKKFYSQAMYSQNPMSGTLWQSCMRYDKCQSFFYIYTRNPNQVSLVILKDEQKEIELVDTMTGEVTTKTEDVQIRGRALLWTDNKGRKFMDRIYSTKDSDVNLFIQYAIKNGWYYKLRQENDESTPLAFNGESLEKKEDNIVTVELEHGGDFAKYPYMDTLKYYNAYKGTLSNNEMINYDFKLEDTNGGNGNCDVCGGSGTNECGECDGDGTQYCNECDGDGKVDCGTCGGSGTLEDSEGNDISCKDCDGSGTEPCGNCDGRGETSCDNCGGDGSVECYECN